MYALLLPAAAALFGWVCGPAGVLLSESLKALLSLQAGAQAGIVWVVLRSLLPVCLLALAAYQVWNIFSVFRKKALLVLAAALVCSLSAPLFPRAGAPLAAMWLFNLLFSLFAAQAALQLALTSPEIMYKNTGLGTLLFLAVIGLFALLFPRETFARVPGAAYWAYAVLAAAAAALQLLCVRKQRNFRLLQITLDDSSMTDSLKTALGSEGIQQLLPYIGRQMREGTSVAKLLLLDMMRGVEFDAKLDLVKTAFDSGPLEVQFAVVDQIFGWSLPYELLPYVVERCEASLAEYLIRMLFLNYADIADHGALDALRERSGSLRRYAQTEEAGRMFDYVFMDRHEGYVKILDGLLGSDRKEDRLFACEIMAGFIGREDAANRKYLAAVIKNTVLNPAELEEMIELCAEYDDGLNYIKNDLSRYYGYAFLKKVCRYYEPVSIVKSFGSSEYPVPMALVLCAACRLEQNSVGAYRAKAGQLIEYLLRLRAEEARIRAAGLSAGRLLLDEIDSLKRTLIAVALDYLLLVEAGKRTEDTFDALAQPLADGETERLLADLSAQTRAALLELLTPEDTAAGDPDYAVLRVSENNALLESIYRYSGGEAMETNLTDNIEKLITLKSIPMFSELDVFTLQQIQKIAVYKKIPAGETVIAEGEEGTSLYVVISGKVGVYKGEKQINEIGAGGLFGEMAIIEKQRRSATIKTLVETSFLMIEGDDFERLLERNSSISGSVIRTLAGRLRKMLEAGR